MRHIAAVTLALSFAVLALAQDAKWEPPAAPEGWKAVASRDGRFRFAVPKDAKGSGTRDRTFSTRGFRAVIQMNYARLKDGTNLEAGAASLSGAELRGKTVDQVLDAIIDVEKEEGFKVSEPKEVTVGDIKAREYRMNNDKVWKRSGIFGVKPRVLAVEGV